MGKRKGESSNDAKNSPKNNKRQKHGKKGKKKAKTNGRFWIEQCKDRKVPKTIPADMIFPLFISRVELTDDHMHGGKLYGDIFAKNEAMEKKKSDFEDSKCTGNEVVAPARETLDSERKPKEHDKVETKEKICKSKEENNEAVTEFAKSIISTAIETKTVGTKTVDREPFIQVIRANSAKGNINDTDFKTGKNLPNGDCGDGIINPFPKDEVADKYWAQRKRFFSKFDDGIKLDKESWYSVTPESIAGHTARRVSKMTESVKSDSKVRGAVVLDVFCGVGGNGIGFALQDDISFVICVDIDREKLRMAANNASIYGVEPTKIVFVEGNAVDVLGFYNDGAIREDVSLGEKENAQDEVCHGYTISGYKALKDRIDTVFLSPPWGGMDYLRSGNSGYELSKCIKVKGADQVECDGVNLLSLAATAARDQNVVYFLPKNINGFDIGKAAWKNGYRNRIELEQNILNGKLKTVTVYLSQK